MAKFEDMTGKTIGNITVITRIVNDSKHEGARWLCKCNACNRLIVTRTDKLNSSKYEGCTHGEEVDIPNVGRVKTFIKDDYYVVDAIGYGEVVLHIEHIVERCRYKD